MALAFARQLGPAMTFENDLGASQSFPDRGRMLSAIKNGSNANGFVLDPVVDRERKPAGEATV
jgi:hypothetical protein